MLIPKLSTEAWNTLVIAVFAAVMSAILAATFVAGALEPQSYVSQANCDQENSKNTSHNGGSPVLVRSHAAIAHGKANEGECGRHHEAPSDFWAAWWTGVLAVVAIVQAAFFLWQLSYMREGVDDAALAARANTDAAKAARDSANVAKLSMVASDRAYVQHAGIRYISHTDNADGSIFWRIRPRWVNNGNTPTRQARVYIHYELRDSELPADYAFNSTPGADYPAMIAPKSVIESGHRNIEAEDIVAISNGEKHLYVWGIARYRDVFPDTPERITKFCVFASYISGDPMKGWDEKTNPVEILFASYHRHNCDDEDCTD